MNLTSYSIKRFEKYLICEEKCEATRGKYLRDVGNFWKFMGDKQITKEEVLSWKASLIGKGYAVRSINSMLAGVNALLDFLELRDCKVKNIRIQHKAYCPEDKELTKEEYLRLLNASKNNQRLNLIIQTICATGIRVSELQFFTVETIRRGEITVDCKNKTRTILVPGKLKTMLLNFAKKAGIKTGAIFVSRTGTPLDRSNIWAAMKKLCQQAGVPAGKVFPHNLRKLFARTFYDIDKDIAKLADILGHSSINTTRVYIMTTGVEHRRKMEQMGLVVNGLYHIM